MLRLQSDDASEGWSSIVAAQPSKRSVCVGHIGYTGTDDDRERWAIVRFWLKDACRRHKNQAGLCRRALLGESQDFIDLRNAPRRDFLAEKQTYEIVVLHNLQPLSWPPNFSISAFHNVETWNARLRLAQPAYVFMFGRDFNSDSTAVDLPGYFTQSIAALPEFTVLSRAELLGSRAEIDYATSVEIKLRSLSQLAANRTLDLSRAILTPAHYAFISKMPNLEELHLSYASVTDEAIETLQNSQRLQTLCLDGTAITSGALEKISLMPNLRCLSLNDTKICDRGAIRIGALKHLEWLSLVNTKITDRAEKALGQCGALRWLSLAGTGFSYSGLQKLARRIPSCEIFPQLELRPYVFSE